MLSPAVVLQVVDELYGVRTHQQLTQRAFPILQLLATEVR